MPWSRTSRPSSGIAEHRLQRLATRWVPARVDDAAPTHDAPRPLVTMPPWRRPALRGLAVVMAVVLLVAGYQAWLGRPRAVAEAPTAVATGPVAPGFPSATARPAGQSSSPASATPSIEPPSSAAPPPEPSPPAPDVVVHVVGQVARPGLYALAAGSRVADAVDAAGGVTKPRAADTVNLARLVVDGEQIAVGAGVVSAPAAAGGPVGVPGAAPMKVDLNTATVENLDTLPGVGPVLAGRIVAWRSANGRFRSVDELAEVAGIGEAILSQIRDLVRV